MIHKKRIKGPPLSIHSEGDKPQQVRVQLNGDEEGMDDFPIDGLCGPIRFRTGTGGSRVNWVARALGRVAPARADYSSTSIPSSVWSLER